MKSSIARGAYRAASVSIIKNRCIRFNILFADFAPSRPPHAGIRAWFPSGRRRIATVRRRDPSLRKDSVKGQWYEKHLSLAYDKGFVVHPEFALDAKPCTRLMMADMMYRIMPDQCVQMDKSAMESSKSKIKDWNAIETNSYSFRDAVLACYSTGLISGYSDGTFGGYNTLNHAQAAVVYCKLADIMGGKAVTTAPAQPAAPVETPVQTPTQTPAQPPRQTSTQSTEPPIGEPTTIEELKALSASLGVPYKDGAFWNYIVLTNAYYKIDPKTFYREFPLAYLHARARVEGWGELPAPKTEEEVLARLEQLHKEIPSGSYFNTDIQGMGGGGCVKWANYVKEYIFTSHKGFKVKTTTGSDIDIWSIKPGDVLQFPNHTAIALGRVEEHSFPAVGIVSYTVPTTDSSNNSYTVDWNFSTDGGHVIASNSNGSFSVRLISHTTYY